MAELTDTQLIILSKAIAREDGAGTVPAKINRGATAKAGSSLVARKLMREIRSKPGMPVWRADAEGKNISLVVTRVGRDAVGVVTPTNETVAAIVTRETDQRTVDAPDGSRGGSKVELAENNATESGDASPAAHSPRVGSKQALVIGMLSGDLGATLNDLFKATGWLPYTTRGALTGLRKRGFELVRSRDAANVSTYRISGHPARAAA